MTTSKKEKNGLNKMIDYAKAIEFARILKHSKIESFINDESIQRTLDISISAMEKVKKIEDALEGTIDHFDRDDAMDLLYDIKDILRS